MPIFHRAVNTKERKRKRRIDKLIKIRDELGETIRMGKITYRKISETIDLLKKEKTGREEDMNAQANVGTKSRPERKRPARPEGQDVSTRRNAMINELKTKQEQRDFQIGNIGAIRVNTHDIDTQYLITYKGCGFCLLKFHIYQWYVNLYGITLKGYEFKDMSQSMDAVLETLNGRHA
jgi:hypothetical protein